MCATLVRRLRGPNRELIQIRADPEWINRVDREAERLGLSLSASIRLVVNEQMERMAPDPSEHKRK
jgi:hypothetical protein